MTFDIPGRDQIEIQQVLFDYNGTIAIDGQLIEGVSELINALSVAIDFHVITADTFGSVENQLKVTNCKIVTIPKDNQDIHKLNYLKQLGINTTLCVGNGRVDKLMLKEAILGVALMQDEGLCTETLLNSDIVCRSVMDVFAYLKEPDRIIATLRN